MTYKISVFKDRQGRDGWKERYMPWWINFLEAYNLVQLGDDRINDSLAEWNCRNIAGSDYIEFTSEVDSTLFLLRFS